MKKLAQNFAKAVFKTKWSLVTNLVLLGGMFIATAQTPGIPYQAYMIDTNGGYAPGEQIEVPLANAEITLQFEVRNDIGEVEYIEQITVTTDEFGMVSTVIGVSNGIPVMGAFDDIDWNGKSKKLYIDIDFSGTGTQFQDHGEMDIIYIPSPSEAPETVTTLLYNDDGSYTYTSEDGTTTTFSVLQHASGDPNILGIKGNLGNIYTDELTGVMYMYYGTSWMPLHSESIGVSGSGAPTSTEPANPDAGDIYVDESTGDVWTYDGTSWVQQTGDAVSDSLVAANGTYTHTAVNGTIVSFNVTQTGVGEPITANPTTGVAGDIYVDESTGNVWAHNGTTWENQRATLANNGLTVNMNNTVQLGGALIQPTTITTDATNTLALTGLEAADTTTPNFSIVVVDNTSGVVEKTSTVSMSINRFISEYTAADGDIDFSTPQTILDLNAIDVYRNGARIDFTQVNPTTIKLDLGALTGCYAGDEIRIVQLQ